MIQRWRGPKIYSAAWKLELIRHAQHDSSTQNTKQFGHAKNIHTNEFRRLRRITLGECAGDQAGALLMLRVVGDDNQNSSIIRSNSAATTDSCLGNSNARRNLGCSLTPWARTSACKLDNSGIVGNISVFRWGETGERLKKEVFILCVCVVESVGQKNAGMHI